MAQRGRKAPVWVQAAIVWFVASGLATAGVLFLRSNDTISDRVFQPLASVICGGGASLETSYGTTTVRRSDSTVQANRRDTFATLNTAECVAPAGARRATPLFVPALWLVSAVPLGLLLVLTVRNQARR